MSETKRPDPDAPGSAPHTEQASGSVGTSASGGAPAALPAIELFSDDEIDRLVDSIRADDDLLIDSVDHIDGVQPKADPDEKPDPIRVLMEHDLERIVNRITLFWGGPALDGYIESLIVDDRKGRRGFHAEVVSALIRLQKMHKDEFGEGAELDECPWTVDSPDATPSTGGRVIRPVLGED